MPSSETVSLDVEGLQLEGLLHLDELLDQLIDTKMTTEGEPSDDLTDSEAMSTPDEQTQKTLNELDSLISELRSTIASLREGEFDAGALESRLRDVTDLASRAASTLESVSR